MGISERQNEILKIIGEDTYVSVNELSRRTFTSPSSIRRDLTRLENLGLVNRSYGGASLPEINGRVAGFYNRLTKSIKEKRLIAQKASALLKSGQSILLDSSTTASFMIPYIAKIDSAVVFTNNLEIAVSAIKQGICTHCIGGSSINGSVSLGGSQAYKALSDISVDIMFFSSQSLSIDGMISDSTEEESYVRSVMLERANKTVFLCDSTKFNTKSLYTLSSLDCIDYAVFDRDFEGVVTKATLI
ncbi:MAG: DeoR/GlpR transcriptional regulator [Clostridia bacterium]|nr:DeoR/GlpR transcriptional regulator [Clostridia bacterium]